MISFVFATISLIHFARWLKLYQCWQWLGSCLSTNWLQHSCKQHQAAGIPITRRLWCKAPIIICIAEAPLFLHNICFNYDPLGGINRLNVCSSLFTSLLSHLQSLHPSISFSLHTPEALSCWSFAFRLFRAWRFWQRAVILLFHCSLTSLSFSTTPFLLLMKKSPSRPSALDYKCV